MALFGCDLLLPLSGHTEPGAHGSNVRPEPREAPVSKQLLPGKLKEAQSRHPPTDQSLASKP
jgi:hypothetical protein